MTKPWIAGGFGWTGFDYKGEPTPDLWPAVNSHYGAVYDLTGLEKDAAFYYKAWWTAAPVIHIMPHWNWEPPNTFPGSRLVPVRVYTNAAAVSLYLNGQFLSTVAVERYKYASFDVQYEPGNLTAIGLSHSGEAVVQTIVMTSGPAARLQPQLLWGSGGISADLENNVALVAVQVVDSTGMPVPTATNVITFSAQGGGAEVIGVGNGDPSCHEPDRAQNRSAFAGKAVAVVQILQLETAPGANGAQDVFITASSPGLAAATLRIPINRVLATAARAVERLVLYI